MKLLPIILLVLLAGCSTTSRRVVKRSFVTPPVATHTYSWVNNNTGYINVMTGLVVSTNLIQWSVACITNCNAATNVVTLPISSPYAFYRAFTTTNQ